MYYKINTPTYNDLLKGISYFTANNVHTVAIGLAIVIKTKPNYCIAKGIVVANGYTDEVLPYDIQHHENHFR